MCLLQQGNITDPPATSTFADSPQPLETRYAVARPDSPPVRVTKPFQLPSEDDVFCSTCLNNQHLFTSSLAQYDVDINPGSPNYKKNEKRYYQYRVELEKRYPQVCEDCEPKVLAKLKDTTKTAKADYLRKLLEKSRNRSSFSTKDVTIYSTTLFSARVLWYLGIFLQLLWHIKMLAIAAADFYSADLLDQGLSLPPSVAAIVLHSTSFNYPLLGIYLSTLAIWWNPKFKEWEKGFRRHITGIDEWYKFQAIQLGFRIFVYKAMQTSVMLDAPFAPASIGAHLFTLFFVLYLTVAAQHSIKVNMAPLWTIPEKMLHVGPAKRAAAQPVTVQTFLDKMPSKKTFQQSASPPAPQYRPRFDPVKRFEECEAMDWAPSPSHADPSFTLSQHRAFHPDQPAQRSSQLFGQAPVTAEKGPFWFQVPPAPITPAQRLRNPPNQPRLRVMSQETKDSSLFQPTEKIPTLFRKEPADVDFAQQKFFTQPRADDDLADLMGSMGSFKIASDESEAPETQSSSLKILVKILGGAIFGVLVLLWTGVISVTI